MTAADERYQLTQALGVPPYTWIPPEKPELTPTDNVREGFPGDAATLEAFQNYCREVRHRSIENAPGEEQLDKHNLKLKKTPHPFSDFSHVHPKDLVPSREPDFARLRANLNNTGNRQLLDDLDNLELMAQQAGAKSAAFQRLRLAFDWIMCRTYELLFNLNQSVVNAASLKTVNNEWPITVLDDYRAARKAYIEFIQNLDNHEPQEKKDEVNPAKCLGYGKVIKWVYIDPIVQPKGPKGEPVITGVTIVIEWNPHSSSSGIPVPHK